MSKVQNDEEEEEMKELNPKRHLENEKDESETKPFLVANIAEVISSKDLRLMDDDKKNDGDLEKSECQDEKRESVSTKLGWRRYLGVLYTMLSTNSFSLSSTILKKYSHIHPFTLGVWAFPLAAIFSVPFILYTVFVEKKSVTNTFWPINKNKKVCFIIWFRAVASCAISYTIIMSFKYISVADTRTIMAASVISVYFCGWIFLGEKCGVVPIFVAILALLGIGVMTRPPILTGSEAFDKDTIIGVSFALGCLVLVTVIVVTLRFLQHVHHAVLNCFLYAWAFGQSIVLAAIFDKMDPPATPLDAFAILSVGLLMALGNLFLVLALQVEEAGVVALIRTSEVIFTFFWQFVVLGVEPDLISILGATLVLTGVIVVTLRKWVASLEPENPTRKRFAFLLL